VPGSPAPGTSGFARPIPPGGATVRAIERQREEEAAPEQSQAFSAYGHDDGSQMAPYLVAAIVLGALAGSAAVGGARRRDRRAYATVRGDEPEPRRPPRRL